MTMKEIYETTEGKRPESLYALIDLEHYLYWAFKSVEIGKRGKDIYHYKGDFEGETYYLITTLCKDWNDLEPEALAMLRLCLNKSYLVDCSGKKAVYYIWYKSKLKFVKTTPEWKDF